MNLRKLQYRTALRLYNEGTTIYVLPCKVAPDFKAPWVQPFAMNNAEFPQEAFRDRINAFEYYNCNNELGKYAAYYTEED